MTTVLEVEGKCALFVQKSGGVTEAQTLWPVIIYNAMKVPNRISSPSHKRAHTI